MGTDVPETGVLPDKNGEPLTIGEYRLFVGEMMNQPAWRAVADKEMDYADGRQLDNELLQKQRELGLPPAVENLITPTLLSVQGYEATIRTDWRVTADGETGGRDVADALNFKLNRAERQSRADKACSDAFRGQIACGIGWVEVTRNPNPFEFPYECGVIHRNAIHWDMKSYKYDLSDARWLIRRRWLLPERLAQFFPEYAGHFKAMGRGGSDWRISGEMLDGGGNTGLADAWGISGRNTVSEEFWFNETTRELAVAEVWYRRWVTADCLRDKKQGARWSLTAQIQTIGRWRQTARYCLPLPSRVCAAPLSWGIWSSATSRPRIRIKSSLTSRFSDSARTTPASPTDMSAI